MADAATLTACPVLEAVTEYRAAGKAVNGECAAWLDGKGKGLDGSALSAHVESKGFTGDKERRWLEATEGLYKLALVTEVSRAGAVAAMELVTDANRGSDVEALGHDVEAIQTLAEMTLRYLRAKGE
jgi:hypothetical protein